MPHTDVDTTAVSARLRALTSAPRCEHCEPAVISAISDIALLLAEVNRLYRALTKERLRSANLEAAIRAALGADNDGEPCPLAYLRDELADITGGAHDA
jgi:hypothetical protein